MVDAFDDKNISPHKGFYDGLSEEERQALADAEGWSVPFDRDGVVVATQDVSDLPFDDIVAKFPRVTLLRIKSPSGATLEYSFAHQFAVDFSKLKPVEYGTSNSAIVEEWTSIEWARATEYALAQALKTLGFERRDDVQYQYVHIEEGQQVMG